MEWQFRNDSPIYTQLTQRLTQAIVAGEFRPGERLPSVRELAVEAGVNPNTVQRALADLERDGLVFSQRTSSPTACSPPRAAKFGLTARPPRRRRRPSSPISPTATPCPTG